MRPILLIMWTAFQSFILRDNNNNWFLFPFIRFLFKKQEIDDFLEWVLLKAGMEIMPCRVGSREP